MYNPNIDCKIICPKCGAEMIYNDMEWVNTLKEWELEQKCPKCHHRFNIHQRDLEFIHKPTNANLLVREANDIQEKILLLIERMENIDKLR